MHLDSADSMPSLQRIKADIDFWAKRLEENPDDAVAKTSLAALFATRFKVAGDINDIHKSDSLYLVANTLFKTSGSSIYRALATNCITQHKFRQAQSYLDTALTLGDDLYLTYLMQCDVAMELGDIDLSKRSINHIADKNNFDYLIREAKLLDHQGNPDKAIEKMEAATQKAIDSKKEILILWAKSNLADMYGHANRFKDSYNAYLDALELRHDYLYALKGIAWLAYSHDKNTAEAKRILNYLSKLHPVPDYDLMLSKIAAYEKDPVTKENLENRFISEVSDLRYGDMYNKYLFNLTIDEDKDLNKALRIAEREVNNRPTPQSYDLLAWTYYNMNKKDEALKIANVFIENKNHEPDALYHLGMIYAYAGNTKKARQFLKEANASGFELGPELADKIYEDLDAFKD